MNIVCRPSALSGTVRAIPSKSDAHRKLICAALSENGGTLPLYPPFCDDIAATVHCLTALGAAIRAFIFLRLDPSSSLGMGEVIWRGLTFDAAAASIFILPFFLWAALRLLLSRKQSVRLSWCFVLMPAVLLAGFMLGDSFYLEESGRHAYSEMRALFTNFTELGLTALTSHPGLCAAIAAGAVIALLLLRHGFSLRCQGIRGKAAVLIRSARAPPGHSGARSSRSTP